LFLNLVKIVGCSVINSLVKPMLCLSVINNKFIKSFFFIFPFLISRIRELEPRGMKEKTREIELKDKKSSFYDAFTL